MEFISIPNLAKLYKKDPTHIRKMVESLGITKHKIKRKKDGRIVTAIADSDHQKLVDHFKNLTAKKASGSYICFTEAMAELGFKDRSNFKRTCLTYNLEIHKKKFNNRTQSCLTQKSFKTLKKIRESITVQDID